MLVRVRYVNENIIKFFKKIKFFFQIINYQIIFRACIIKFSHAMFHVKLVMEL
jgi:hypothetical protein